jgi:hypothetical protein
VCQAALPRAPEIMSRCSGRFRSAALGHVLSEPAVTQDIPDSLGLAGVPDEGEHIHGAAAVGALQGVHL